MTSFSFSYRSWMPFPYELPIPPNFSHPVKGHGVQHAIFRFHFEREVLAWFDGYPLEWHALELVFDFILVGELKFPFAEFGVPADASKQFVDWCHVYFPRGVTVTCASPADSDTSKVTGRNCSISHIAVRACSEALRVLNDPLPASAR